MNRICDLLAKGAANLGLSFTNDKAQLLLPKDWIPSNGSLPSGIELRSNTFEDVKLRGIEVVGCPVGSPDFCARFVQKNLDTMLQ